MAKTPKQLDEFLRPMRDHDLGTLEALDQKLHLLLEQKRQHEQDRGRDNTKPDEFLAQCARLKIDPDLLSLVGIQPERPVTDDKIIIRDAIARRLTD